MKHEEIYHSKEIKRKFDLKKGDSLFVWQIVANVFGNLVYLDHIAYTSKGEGAPTEPKFDDVKLGSSGLGMVRYGGINRLNPYLARDLID
ncbi:MAG: hypothetical protein GPI90_09940 [Microcystis aeruginosa K13-05]|jgi:hypothetical protein|uniref:hypothetical protein n=1 Tax=unclassified Microcystis TaxID=2643300 RepID=UPI0022C91825|nr:MULTISPECIES: hypothetical protein [unclassified Microcystis]MCZ8049108.1 hypothetical protein [Microcystis sp. LE19-41.2A]MCZ8289423.1 hypothetical protein [Microcystis sp. LE19-59.1C]NCR80324.1 hypothetical protein [Microcystis aeruginosa K13-10]NCR84950.1 hypothetical protein [Microcystis aeruginosa K13-05]